MDAAATYRRRSIESATPLGLVVMLYQAATQDLRRAITAVEAGDIEARTKALNHLLAIIGELRGALNFDQGGPIARQFAAMYRLAEQLIMQATFERRAEPLRELLGHFILIRDAWRHVESLPSVSGQSQSAWDA